jgi:hypothetical protein
MFLTVGLQTVFITEFVGMRMVDIYAKFRMHNSSGELMVTIKQKAKYRFHAADILSS